MDFEIYSGNKLLPKVPVIIKIQCRNLDKIKKNYDKPFSEELNSCFTNVLYKLCIEVEGVVFGYHYDDTILLITKNDQTPETAPWYNNDVQKIASATSSLATLAFYKSLISYDVGLDLFEDIDTVFTSFAYTVPNIDEVLNILIKTQEVCIEKSAYDLCYHKLIDEFNKEKTESILYKLSFSDKIKMLQERFSIDYREYPDYFRLGQICFRAPKMINDKIKFKWSSFKDKIPFFPDKKEALYDFISGKEVKLLRDDE